MLFKLNEIEKGKPTRLQVTVEPHEMGDPSYPLQVESGDLDVSIYDHPGGFFMKYQIRARVQAPCSSCGQLMEFEISSNGGIGLQMEQPQGQHIVLTPEEMDIRFLKTPELDLIRFFDEQVELELPQFPKHSADANCLQNVLPESSEVEADKITENSPFSVLNSMLKKEN